MQFAAAFVMQHLYNIHYINIITWDKKLYTQYDYLPHITNI